MNMRTNEHGMLLLGIGNRFRPGQCGRTDRRGPGSRTPVRASGSFRRDRGTTVRPGRGFHTLRISRFRPGRSGRRHPAPAERADRVGLPLRRDRRPAARGSGDGVDPRLQHRRGDRTRPHAAAIAETVVLFGIAADDFAMGETPGAAVQSGCTEAAELILELLLHRATVKPDFTGEWYRA